MERCYCVYLMTNQNHTVLYTGVTNDLLRRAYQHRELLCPGFTREYQCTKLVYYEVFRDVRDAIAREKQIKGGSRRKKTSLIDGMNPEWKDLYPELVDE